jgi:hypothetical protein
MNDPMLESKLLALGWIAVDMEVRLPWLGNFMRASFMVLLMRSFAC